MKSVRAVVIAALIFLGVTSLVGAIPLILDPSGVTLSMPLSLLEHSPFSNFLIPGLILLFANGVLSFIVLAMVFRQTARYGWWILAQGCVLASWITIEVFMIRLVVWVHYVYWALALVLMMGGWLLRKDMAAKKGNADEV